MADKKVIILGKKCTLQFGKYPNGTVGLWAMHRGEHYGTLSVNWQANWQGFAPYEQAMKFPIVVIKDYSENEGVMQNLIDAGVVHPGAYMAGTNGTVHVCMLTEEWQEYAKNSMLINA